MESRTNHRQAIVSIVERKTKFTLLKKITRKTADSVLNALNELLTPIKHQVLSITADNGPEFAKHQEISSQLDLDFYFAHPYSSWERGLNENTNGLVRQFIPKGCEFDSVTHSQVEAIQKKLNSRPRKTLNYQTPAEAFCLAGSSQCFDVMS